MLPGSALPLKTFQQRHEAARSRERDFISPTSLLQHTMSIHRQGQWQQESNGFRDMNLSKLWEVVKDRGAWRAEVHGIAELETTEQLN